MEGVEDEQLMIRYVEGDESAFRELFERYKGRIYGYLVKRARDRRLADDLFQTVLLKLHRSRAKYDPSYLFSAWLFTICRNVVVDHARKASARAIISTLEGEAEKIPAPETGNISDERRWEELLSRLSPKQRQMIELRYGEELSFDEIASRMNTTAGNVRQMVSRTIRKMKGSG